MINHGDAEKEYTIHSLEFFVYLLVLLILVIGKNSDEVNVTITCHTDELSLSFTWFDYS